jgi:hypothetical protein
MVYTRSYLYRGFQYGIYKILIAQRFSVWYTLQAIKFTTLHVYVMLKGKINYNMSTGGLLR